MRGYIIQTQAGRNEKRTIGQISTERQTTETKQNENKHSRYLINEVFPTKSSTQSTSQPSQQMNKIYKAHKQRVKSNEGHPTTPATMSQCNPSDAKENQTLQSTKFP
jgi:hypothetical protein